MYLPFVRQTAVFINHIWIAPCQALIILAIMWYQLGPASLAAIVVLFLAIPFQVWMAKTLSKLRFESLSKNIRSHISQSRHFVLFCIFVLFCFCLFCFGLVWLLFLFDF